MAFLSACLGLVCDIMCAHLLWKVVHAVGAVRPIWSMMSFLMRASSFHISE